MDDWSDHGIRITTESKQEQILFGKLYRVLEKTQI